MEAKDPTIGFLPHGHSASELGVYLATFTSLARSNAIASTRRALGTSRRRTRVRFRKLQSQYEKKRTSPPDAVNAAIGGTTHGPELKRYPHTQA